MVMCCRNATRKANPCTSERSVSALAARSIAKRALQSQMEINYGCMYATEAPLNGALIVTQPPPFTDAPITV